MIARELCRRASPDTFQNNSVDDNRDYGELLRRVLDDVNTGGINVILTPADTTQLSLSIRTLRSAQRLYLLCRRTFSLKATCFITVNIPVSGAGVGTVYRRISDEYIDPMTFYAGSLLGVPHIIDSYRAGNVAIVNAPGNGIADDKGVYYFVPQMIKYYLGEEPILNNAVTYLPIIKKISII